MGASRSAAVVGAKRGPRLRRQPRCVDDVLHSDRNPEQRQSPRLLPGQFGLPGRGAAGAVGVDLDPRADLGLRRLDAFEALVENFDRPEVARAQRAHRVHKAPSLADGHMRPLRSVHVTVSARFTRSRHELRAMLSVARAYVDTLHAHLKSDLESSIFAASAVTSVESCPTIACIVSVNDGCHILSRGLGSTTSPSRSGHNNENIAAAYRRSAG